MATLVPCSRPSARVVPAALRRALPRGLRAAGVVAALAVPAVAFAQAPSPPASADALAGERRDVERLSKELTGLTQQAEALARDLEARQREIEAEERARRNRNLALFAGLGAAVAAFLFVRSRRASGEAPRER
ncbi:MAG: hypothetical protein IT376_04040 [Polyangiaceae bacterium]|nr:hypothetical protein [Polyangiaceae bacterium]